MNPVGIGIASITGLLAVYLYINQSSHVSEKNEEMAAEMRCQKAEFDVDFAEKWNDRKEKLLKLKVRSEAECKKFEGKREVNETVGVERSKNAQELQDSIGKMMK